MKHHVLLLQESIMIKGSYLVNEYNKTEDGNEIPIPGLADQLKNLTLAEAKTELRRLGFLEIFSTIQQQDQNGKIVEVPIGQCSFVEMLLAGTVVITILWFNVSGLPINRTIYDMRIEED